MTWKPASIKFSVGRCDAWAHLDRGPRGGLNQPGREEDGEPETGNGR